MKVAGKSAVLCVALSLLSVPIVACLSSGSALSSEEQECCRKMAEGCGEMQMPSSHSCCTTTTVRQAFPYLASSRSSVSVAREPLAVLPVVKASLAADRIPHDRVYLNTHAPPESPPGSISVLRI